MNEGGFALVDWAIVALYLVFVFSLGAWFARRERNETDFFLAGRSMPAWAAGVSLLATSLSAVTFLGAPQAAYAGDLTYLATNIGTILGMLVVAFLFLPAFYRAGVTTVYEFLEDRLGVGARRWTSGTFMLGRVFASGARLYIASIPLSLIVFGDIAPTHLILSILVVATIASIYTMLGGISAVIWTDTAQLLILLTAALGGAWLLFNQIPLSGPEMVEALQNARTETGNPKLTLLDTSFDLSRPFTLPACVVGFTLISVAAYGTDQDLAQRMLTCRSPLRASLSMIGASIATIAIAGVFLALGLLLWLRYEYIGVSGGSGPPEDTRRVFLHFILSEMPIGLRGLMIAGLLAAAMSSLDSALNALASASVCDFGKRHPGEKPLQRARWAVIGWAGALAGFASLSVIIQKGSEEGLIEFALGVMVFAFAGMLGVFLTALLTKRGNSVSAAAALISGFLIVGVLQFGPRYWTDWGVNFAPSLSWRMAFASGAAFIICAAGKPNPNRGRPCPNCGYDLLNIRVDYACPECGQEQR